MNKMTAMKTKYIYSFILVLMVIVMVCQLHPTPVSAASGQTNNLQAIAAESVQPEAEFSYPADLPIPPSPAIDPCQQQIAETDRSTLSPVATGNSRPLWALYPNRPPPARNSI